MSGADRHSDAVRRIRLEAAEWVVKQDAGLTAEDQDAFSLWLAADPRHKDWLARQRESWQALEDLSEWRPQDACAPNIDLLAAPPPAARWRRFYMPIAAAAAVVLAVWGAGKFTRAPELGATAGIERRLLEDGSTIDLPPDAQVQIAFTPGERRVRLLRGEAQFTVAPAKARPFVVSAGDLAVRAVGTAFTVRLDSRNIDVLVTEGHVTLNAASSAPAEAPMVNAGQRARVERVDPRAPPRIVAAPADELRRVIARQPELLEFSSAPLSLVIAEFNRHNRVRLVLGDDALGALPLVAALRPNNLDGFVELLEATAGVRAERRPGEIVLRRAP